MVSDYLYYYTIIVLYYALQSPYIKLSVLYYYGEISGVNYRAEPKRIFDFYFLILIFNRTFVRVSRETFLIFKIEHVFGKNSNIQPTFFIERMF